MPLLSRATASLAVAAALAAPPLAAQRVTPSTYAITNARIVPVAGPAIEKGTIVIRDGIITAVGATVAVPADARVVDATGHTVYPGLIDAYSTLGLRTAAAAGGGGGGGGGGGFGGGAAAVRPAGAPNSRQPVGLQPEVRAVDQLVEDSDFSAAYAAGITTALSAPTGRVYEGQSALISLQSADFGAMAIKPAVTLNVGFQGVGGGNFPGSLMGVFAALRQSFLDAQHYGAEKAAYEKNPRSAKRPEYDPSLEALQPVLAGTMPVVFRANSAREIERVLDLAKEFKLKAIIGGGQEANLVADRLKADNVPVLLSVNFPRRTVAPAADADPEPLSLLRARVQAPKAPGLLKTAGVRFAIQAGGNHADFVANLRRAVAGGLSADDALRAATLGSAELLGAADRLGSIETGKIANLTVVRGNDLFAADARVSDVWVDGRPHAVPAPVARGPGGAGGGQRPPGLEGSWQLQVQLDGHEYIATLALRDQDGEYRGTIEGDLGANDIVDLVVNEDGSIEFSTTITTSEGTEEAKFRGTLERGVLSGTIAITGSNEGRFAGLRRSADQTTDRARAPQER